MRGDGGGSVGSVGRQGDKETGRGGDKGMRRRADS